MKTLSSLITKPVTLGVAGFLLVLALGIWYVRCDDKSEITKLITTTDIPNISAETQNLIRESSSKVLQNPENLSEIFALAQNYLQVIRENADTGFYKNIEKLLKYAESVEKDNPEIPYLRAQILLGQHKFSEALSILEPLTTEYDKTTRYLNALTDSLIELGRYEDARKTLEKISDIRPDYGSLTRIAYLREIYGDVPGAIQVMNQATGFDTFLPENIAWGLSEIGRLQFISDLDTAEQVYKDSLKIYPDFPPSLAGLAQIEMAKGNLDRAKEILENLLKVQPQTSYAALLGDIYKLEGNESKAEVYYKIVEVGYEHIAQSGTNVDQELASFWVLRKRNGLEALKLAEKLYQERPTIFNADVAAWAAYQQGELEKASTYIDQALATGSEDPLILFHAGMIAKELGDRESAAIFLTGVQEISPHFSPLDQPELQKTLQELKPFLDVT